MIAANEGASLLITDRSEGNLLGTRYRTVGKYMLYAILLGGALIIYIIYKK
jgi:hypothetical protein